MDKRQSLTNLLIEGVADELGVDEDAAFGLIFVGIFVIPTLLLVTCHLFQELASALESITPP